MVTIIKNLCESAGTNISAVEQACGLSNASIRRWDKSWPSLDKALAVARYFDVTLEYLLGIEVPNDITPKEAQLVKAWREADEKERELVAFALRERGFVYAGEKSSAC